MFGYLQTIAKLQCHKVKNASPQWMLFHIAFTRLQFHLINAQKRSGCHGTTIHTVSTTTAAQQQQNRIIFSFELDQSSSRIAIIKSSLCTSYCSGCCREQQWQCWCW